MSDFKNCISDTDVAAMRSVSVAKVKRVFEIRLFDSPLTIKTKCRIKYGFATNKFKPELLNAGSVVLQLTPSMIALIEELDERVCRYFEDTFTGSILNNVMMTKNATRAIFRPSVYSGSLRVHVSGDSCALIDEDNTTVLDGGNPDLLARRLRAGEAIGLVVQPAFAWFMNKRIGVRWNARQIRLKIPMTGKEFMVEEEEVDMDEEEEEEGTKNRKRTIDALFDDSDDEDANKFRDRAPVSSKRTIDYLFEDDD